MKRRSFVFLWMLLLAGMAQAQTFVTHGKIEFERKVNQHAFLEEGNTWDEMTKKNTAKFYTNYYDLYFKDGVTLYTIGKETDARIAKVWGIFPSENMVRVNLDSNSSTTYKEIYNDRFIVADSLRKVEWKIGTEIRKIAGFDCRKAVGKIMDSIVVIAFYTDEILPSGGPESFTGLPGMILGIAIPRMHTTWYATKLEVIEVPDKKMALPAKGKKVSRTEFTGQLTEILKNWGEEGKRLVTQILL